MTANASRARRPRGARESLGSIVLGFEIVIVFLGALVAFGLHALAPAVALLGGAGVIVLMFLSIALLRGRVGVWLGTLVQLVVIASGVLVGMMFIVGAIFMALWLYCMAVGTRLDAAKAARLGTDAPAETGAHERRNDNETENNS